MLANPKDFHPGRALVEYGACSELESAVLRQLPVRPGIVVEVGATIGVHTVPLAREPREVRVCRQVAGSGLFSFEEHFSFRPTPQNGHPPPFPLKSTV